MSAPPAARQPKQSRFGPAVDAFLSQPGFSPMTVRSYRQTLRALSAGLGDEGVPSAGQLKAALTLRWGTAAPATWNRHVATVSSFLAYSERHRLLPTIDVRLDRRREREDRTRSIAKPELERIWALRVPVREKALWRLLYETAARASEALSLDIEDLDLPNRCATIAGKGGGREYVFWQTPTARLLPHLIAGRPGGPLFTTARRARLELAADDLCPHTGHGGEAGLGEERVDGELEARVRLALIGGLPGAHAARLLPDVTRRGDRRRARSDATRPLTNNVAPMSSTVRYLRGFRSSASTRLSAYRGDGSVIGGSLRAAEGPRARRGTLVVP